YTASYLPITLGATSSLCARDIKKILDSVGIDPLNKAVSELNERNTDEVMPRRLGSSPACLLAGPWLSAAASA
ncbi:60S acidic ribosomal protein P2, partial [Lemmus lemmus]